MTLSRKLAQLIVEKNVSVDAVVKVLLKYNLVGLLPAIKDGVVELSSHMRRGDIISIESPFVLSEEVISHIKKITKSEKIEHEVTINKKILAGFKARWRGVLYDGSAERIIRQLTK
jgi:F0F1-type ATP synthase delta subunit